MDFPNLLFLIAFPVFCPETRQPESSVKKQEDGENNSALFRKILNPGTIKNKKPENEKKGYDK